MDIEQLHLVLEEPLDPSTFSAAWQSVALRHTALGAYFAWQETGGPQQQISTDLAIPLVVDDWTDLDAAAREKRLRAFLAADRARGFALERPPLMRVALFRRGSRSEVVWTFHHILLDGRSVPLVLRELFATYAAMRSGQRSVLPCPPRPYRDYVAWLATRDLEASRRFFRALLAGKSAPTPLPCAEPLARPLDRDGYGERTHELSAELLASLRALAQRTHTSMSTIAHAAWALVLSRYTRESDVLFGSTRNCRRSALDGAAETMVGLFMNTLPIRTNIEPDHTVAQLLVELRRQSLALRAHEHTPIVEIQGQSPTLRGAPLFESVLTFENRGLSAWLQARENSDPYVRSCKLHEQPAPPLNLLFTEGNALEVRLLFDRRRFRDAVIDRLLASLCHVFSEFLDEQRSLREVEVIPPDERHRLLWTWNDTAREFPEQHLIHEPFERTASRSPEAEALVMNGQSMSYGELESRANQLAHALRLRGVGPGKFVGVCLDRGFDLVVALLAVVKTGAAYLPLQPSYPVERLQFMMEDAQACLVITELRHEGRVSGERLLIDAEASALAALPRTRLEREIDAGAPCYAIFTSGSTGAPNGVLLSHRAVMNTLDWVNRTFALGPGDRGLFVTSPGFDLSVFDIFGLLGAGATVVIASEQQLAHPAALLALVREERITFWNSAPAVLQQLVPLFGAHMDSCLRLVFLSGDWIPLSLPEQLHREFPAARVISLGGATEAAIWSNWYPIGELEPRWVSVPYGRPIQNARYHVLDEEMRPVPVGVPGDLYIGGACLAEGYLNRPELTRARFLRDPFSGDPRERLYKTGDLARYFDDGNLEFLGRSDFQIKVRGFRVELGEVEAAICALAGIRDVACKAHRDGSGQLGVAAYVTLEPSAELDESSIKQALRGRLPDYMVPAHVVVLSALPLSSNGKVDRNALPEPGARTHGLARVPPNTLQEQQLVALWEELLQRSPVGITDNFFELGGHSLLALAVVTEAKTRFGLEISLPRLMEQPTIEGVLDSLRSSREVERRVSVRTFHEAGSRPPLVLLAGGAYALLYRELPPLLGPEQPVYLVETPPGQPLTAAMEATLLAGLPSDRPIVVGGFCGHAKAAWTLALRLTERGRRVPLLVLFDGHAPEPSMGARIKSAGRRVLRLLRPRARGAEQATLELELLFIASERSAGSAAPPTNGWSTWVGGSSRVLSVPGEHMSFLGVAEHEARVVAALRDGIERAGSC